MRRLIPLAFALSLLTALTGAAPGHSAGPQMAFGAAEDIVRQQDPAVAREKMAQLADAGMRAVRITSFWVPPATAPDNGEIATLKNVADAARRYGVTVYVTVMSPGSKTTPLTPEAQAQFAQYAAGVVRAVPAIRDVIVGNEPNLNRFWLPQFNPDGTDAAAPAYVSLLAQTYDAIKAVDPTITVFGGALAPRGVDKPNTGRDTHSPTAFITDMGVAYRASGRTLPLMDGFTFHPYGEASNVRPDLPHPNSTSIGLADYDKLVALLGQAFDGTAQAGSSLPILYDEYGVETTIPDLKASSYTGTEPATTHPVDETTQAAYYTQALQMVFCQPNVVGILLFHSQDENARASWQSGVYYADGSEKASLSAVRTALQRAHGGSIAHCDGLLLDVAPTTLRLPKATSLPTGKAAIQLVCPLDCVATVQLFRSDGRKIWGRRVYGLADTKVTIKVGKLRLRPGRYAFSASVVHPVNPGDPTVTQGGTFIVH
jgi:hypothetical protein